MSPRDAIKSPPNATLTDVRRPSSKTCFSLQLLACCVVAVGSLAVPRPGFAQYLGNNFHGDFGVNSGTQAGPGFYVAIPFAQWNADHIKDADGNKLAASAFQGLDIRAMFPTLIGVTPQKLLGANYGFMVAPPFSTIRPERTIPETFEKDWGLNDRRSYRCISAGIHRARISSRGTVFMRRPGGTRRAPTTTSDWGIWSQEIQAGTTVYLDAAKKISAATTAYFELHSNKKDQDLKVGTLADARRRRGLQRAEDRRSLWRRVLPAGEAVG